MSKSEDQEHLEMTGTVQTSIRGVLQVELESGQIIDAHLSGKMKLHKINVVPGDKVKVKVSPYDLTKGFIIYRDK